MILLYIGSALLGMLNARIGLMMYPKFEELHKVLLVTTGLMLIELGLLILIIKI